MLKLILGVVVGALAVWLTNRENVREQINRRVASAPAPLRQRAEDVRAATASGAGRLTDVVQAAPLPSSVKSRAQAALASVQPSGSGPGGGAGSPAPAETPNVPEPLETRSPDDVLAEQDAAARAAEDARREQQAGL